MKVAISTHFTETAPKPGLFAREVEALGFESLWVPEHPAVPVSITSNYPPGGAIPESFFHWGDQFVALAMAAATTQKIKLATGIYIVPYHHPLLAANQVATLDLVSDGRVIFGIGAGWMREEAALYGVDFPHRWTQTAEYIAAIREAWSPKREASFEGKYVKFAPFYSYPKPLQQPGPPVIIGSLDKNAMKRIARWADGWCPTRITAETYAERIKELKQECAAVGRDFSQLDLTVCVPRADDRAQAQELLRKYSEAGAGRYVVQGAYAAADYRAELEGVAKAYL
jgi:probable F420-dependent oxidoreductase